ncbi:MAG TPA: tetratricopeptide repeat protein [Planctomycetota bacterium]|nr:tetratricopeptide repeat protein [Planctomycetota bacterium]HPF12624.1 tetratricopeptide repeat protein [Planctomycetota bacterium]HRV79788.1 tetratricopeptide repeat protein [Planctomycetota bacterium]
MQRPTILVWTALLPLVGCVSVPNSDSTQAEVSSPQAQAGPTEAVIAITPDGGVLYGGRNIGLEAVTPTLEALLAQGAVSVRIESTGDLPDGLFSKVMKATSAAGVTDITAILGATANSGSGVAEAAYTTGDGEPSPEALPEGIDGSSKIPEPEPNAETVEAVRTQVEGATASLDLDSVRAYPAQVDQLQMWNDPRHRERFLQSYLAESDVTPFLSDPEREVLLKARDYVAQDKVPKALALLNKEKNDTSTAVYDYFLAQLHYQLGELDQAMVDYQVAVGKYPKYRQAWRYLGMLQVQNGRFEEARESFTHVIELGGADNEMYGALGYCYANLEQPLAAETAYRMATLLEPANRDWKIGLARALFDQGQYAPAVTMFENLIAENPGTPELWLMQGEALKRAGKTAEAAKNFEMVDRLGKATPASLNSLADIYAQDGLYDLAADRYLRALQADCTGSEARALRGAEYLVRQGALEDARTLLEGMQRIGGSQLATATQKGMLSMRATLALQAGDAEEEANLLEASLRLDPMDGRALIQLGQYKERHEDLETALLYYSRASKVEGFEAEAVVAQGQALARAGRYQEALPLLKDGFKRKPSSRLESYIQSVERMARRG